MAVNKSDIYQHANPNYAFVDSEFVRGGGRVVADLTELYALYSKVDQLKENITKVYVTSEDKTYILVNITDVTLEIFNSTAWEIDSIGGGHVITSDIESFTQRSNLKFIGGVTITDDDITDSTIIEITGGGGTETDPIFTQWLLDNPTSGENTGDQDLSNLAPLNHNHTGVYEAANSNIQSHISSTSNPHSVTKNQVGLGDVDNTSDANKPVSTDQAIAIGLKISTSEKGIVNGVATLDGEGFVPSSQLRTVGSDVIELLEITNLIGEVVDMIEGDKVFDTSDSKIYTYISEIWSNPTTPEADKLYLCKADTLTYKWNGITLVTTTSPLPYASAALTVIGTSTSLVTNPYGVFTAFKYWLTNTIFSSLTTGVQNIIGAINELKYGKQEAGTNNITPTASGGTYTILNNRINNLRSVWLTAGTHNINLATVSDNNIMNEQYIIFRTGGTVPTINFVQPYYNGLGTVAITNGSTSVTVAGTNANMTFKAGQVFIADGVTYTVASVTNSATIVLSVAATVDFTGAYTYRPMLNYVYFPTVAINQLWHISFLYTNNSYAWVCDVSVRVI